MTILFWLLIVLLTETIEYSQRRSIFSAYYLLLRILITQIFFLNAKSFF